MNRIIALIMFLIFLLSSVSVYANTVTMYSPDGRKADVWENEIQKYASMGWEREPVCVVYSPANNDTSVIYKSELATYLGVGWLENTVMTMYSPDGALASIWKAQEQIYKNAGWYDVPVVRMYAPGGKVCVIAASEIDLYRNVGWYPVYDFVPGKNADEIRASFGDLVNYTNDFNSPVYLTNQASEIDAGFVFSGSGSAAAVKSGFAPFGTIFPYLAILAASDGTLSPASLGAFFGTQLQGANGTYTFFYDNHTFIVSANSNGNITMNSICAYN